MRKPLIHTHCHLICCVYIKGYVSIHIVWCWRCQDRLIQEIKAKSKTSKMVFVAFMQHYIQSTDTHLTHVKDVKYYVLRIQWPLTPVRREGYLLQYSIWKAFHLGCLVVHHQSVWGGSFVNFLRLVKLQGWLQARHTANSQFLKLMGTQQPSNSCISTNRVASSIS